MILNGSSKLTIHCAQTTLEYELKEEEGLTTNLNPLPMI